MTLRMGEKIGITKEADFFVLLACWFFFGDLFRTLQADRHIFAAWVLFSSVISMAILTAIGYFDHHIPKPELGGVVSLLFALPLAGFLGKWVLMLSSHIPPIRYTEALRASVWVALVFEASQIFIFKARRARGTKWSLVTHLRPQELRALHSQIEASDASWWIQVRPYDPADQNGGRLRGDETLVISRQAAHDLKNCADLLTAHLRGQRIVDITQLLKEFRGRVSLHNSDGWSFLLGSTYKSFPIRFYFHVKEVLEVLLAAFLLAVFSPLFIAIGLSIWVTSGRPVIYRQKRLGYQGRPFHLYKFRTMPLGAETTGPQWARQDDPRTTPLGRWLRKTRLDELPQLINVIRGELSFVGPRPERPEFYEMLNNQIPLFSTRLLVRPGITGWAQVRQGYAGTVEECKTKLEYDLYYVQHMSPRFDLEVMIHTAALMMKGNGGR